MLHIQITRPPTHHRLFTIFGPAFPSLAPAASTPLATKYTYEPSSPAVTKPSTAAPPGSSPAPFPTTDKSVNTPVSRSYSYKFRRIIFRASIRIISKLRPASKENPRTIHTCITIKRRPRTMSDPSTLLCDADTSTVHAPPDHPTTHHRTRRILTHIQLTKNFLFIYIFFCREKNTSNHRPTPHATDSPRSQARPYRLATQFQSHIRNQTSSLPARTSTKFNLPSSHSYTCRRPGCASQHRLARC